MCRSEDGTIKMQFKRLLVLFEDILKESEDYHIIKFPKLGYVAILGEYLPGKDDETVISRLSFHKFSISFRNIRQLNGKFQVAMVCEK